MTLTEYEQECLRILKTYPKQMEKISNYERCQYARDFLGFLDMYLELDIPTNFTVIDLGCNQAVQAIYFESHKQYIGVDNATPNEYRFKQNNAVHYEQSIQEFCNKTLPTLHLNMDKVFAICSYVPDEEAQALVADTFKYHKVVYCKKVLSGKMPKEKK